MSRATESARRIHAEALELQRLFAATPMPPSGRHGDRAHPLLHAGLLVLLVTLASAALVVILARPAVS